MRRLWLRITSDLGLTAHNAGEIVACNVLNVLILFTGKIVAPTCTIHISVQTKMARNQLYRLLYGCSGHGQWNVATTKSEKGNRWNGTRIAVLFTGNYVRQVAHDTLRRKALTKNPPFSFISLYPKVLYSLCFQTFQQCQRICLFSSIEHECKCFHPLLLDFDQHRKDLSPCDLADGSKCIIFKALLFWGVPSQKGTIYW